MTPRTAPALRAENSLLASGYDLQSYLLKVGHYGSSSASSSVS
jgi:beta-lactamase superfamily II metal-dependent hydrolase